MDVKFPHIKVKLTGRSGNAFAVLGAVKQALKQHKVAQEDIDAFVDKATSGDYNDLLATAMQTVDVE